jgi:hypothetical protein
MKRHAGLWELSRDHHRALVVAQRLRRADASTADDARIAFLDYWERDGRAHFAEEEEVLLPAVGRFVGLDQPKVNAVLSDHDRIRRLALKVAQGAEVAELRTLGVELARHVRREEPGLFPLIERAMPEPELVALAARLREDSREGR